MSLGTILVIVLIIFLLGGFSGQFGGYGYGFGHGGIGVIGVFVPEDPKAPSKLEQKGQIAFDLGLFFSKGLQMGSGQATSKNTTVICAISFTKTRWNRRSSCPTNCRSRKRRPPTNISMRVRTAGRRCYSSRRREANFCGHQQG